MEKSENFKNTNKVNEVAKKQENPNGLEVVKIFEDDIDVFLKECVYKGMRNSDFDIKKEWKKIQDIDFGNILDNKKEGNEYLKNFREKFHALNGLENRTLPLLSRDNYTQIINPDTAFLDYEKLNDPELVNLYKNDNYLKWLQENNKEDRTASALEYVSEKFSETHYLPGVEYYKYLVEDKKRIPDSFAQDAEYLIPSSLCFSSSTTKFFSKDKNKDIKVEDWSCQSIRPRNTGILPRYKEDEGPSKEDPHAHRSSSSLDREISNFRTYVVIFKKPEKEAE